MVNFSLILAHLSIFKLMISIIICPSKYWAPQPYIRAGTANTKKYCLITVSPKFLFSYWSDTYAGSNHVHFTEQVMSLAQTHEGRVDGTYKSDKNLP